MWLATPEGKAASAAQKLAKKYEIFSQHPFVASGTTPEALTDLDPRFTEPTPAMPTANTEFNMWLASPEGKAASAAQKRAKLMSDYGSTNAGAGLSFSSGTGPRPW